MGSPSFSGVRHPEERLYGLISCLYLIPKSTVQRLAHGNCETPIYGGKGGKEGRVVLGIGHILLSFFKFCQLCLSADCVCVCSCMHTFIHISTGSPQVLLRYN